MSYCTIDACEAKTHKPTVVFVDEANKPARITSYEKHGKLADLQ
jgi:aspartate 1-decarboxylase